MEENRIPKRVLYMNLETRPRASPRNRWQDEMREDGRIVSGEEWQRKVYDREEWKKLLRTPRNRHFCTCQWNRIEPYNLLISWDNSVGIVASLCIRQRNHGSIHRKGDICLFTKISWAYPASSSLILGVPSPTIKQSGHEADNLPPFSAKLKNEQQYTSNPYICLSDVQLLYLYLPD
jgi:hypothetical protein